MRAIKCKDTPLLQKSLSCRLLEDRRQNQRGISTGLPCYYILNPALILDKVGCRIVETWMFALAWYNCFCPATIFILIMGKHGRNSSLPKIPKRGVKGRISGLTMFCIGVSLASAHQSVLQTL